jgi:hypothetical protein
VHLHFVHNIHRYTEIRVIRANDIKKHFNHHESIFKKLSSESAINICVQMTMCKQFMRCMKQLFTNTTSISTRVSALCVHGESGGLRKRHAALVALVRSYARVRARVNTKSAAYGKRFIAFITFVPDEYSYDQFRRGRGKGITPILKRQKGSSLQGHHVVMHCARRPFACVRANVNREM